VYDRFEAEGKGKETGLYISRTNPENVLIDHYLEYVCPENPEILGQQQVAGWNATFKVKCIGDGQFEKIRKIQWPGCRVPGTCLAVDGPAVPEDSGLVQTYVDKLEFTNISFKCVDKTQEPIGPMVVERPGQGKVIEVLCGRKWSDSGVWEEGTAAWEVPSAWPNCEFKDEFSCDPSTEITIPDWTGLIPENTKFILASSMKEINGVGQMKNEYGYLKCRDENLITDNGTRIPIRCDTNGNFEAFANASWPICRMPTCEVDKRPNNTGELEPLSDLATDVGSFLDFACPGGNVTDDGRTIQVQCIAKQLIGQPEPDYVYEEKYAVPDPGWPACRSPVTCSPDDVRWITTDSNDNATVIGWNAALATGLICNWTDAIEFTDFNCTCNDSNAILDSDIRPRCGKGGNWKAPSKWPNCIIITTTTTTTTTTTLTTTTITENAATVTGTTTTADPNAPAATTTIASNAATTTVASAVTITTTPATTTTATTTVAKRKKRDVEGIWTEDDAEDATDSFDIAEKNNNFFFDEEEEDEFEEEYSEEEQGIRVKRAASTTNNYIHVWVEVQFSKKRPQLGMTMTNFSANIDRLIFAMNGTFGEKVLKPKVNLVAASNSSDNATSSSNATDTSPPESDGAPQMVMVPSPDYMTLEMPPYGQEDKWPRRGPKCRDCIKYIDQNTCPNDLLELMKTGYAHSKPVVPMTNKRGKTYDSFEVLVGSTVDLYCEDYWKKPKKDTWDDDKTDGIVTALCQPNLKFSVPYDISSWGSCLAKCPASKPVPPEPLDKHKLLLLDEVYMTQEKVLEELWEGEEIVYKCKNDTLVINNNPDQKTVKYKCRVSGRYNSPDGDEEWPVCTKKPIRPEIMRAIRLMTSKFDKNIEYRNALYGGSSLEEGGTSEMTKRFLAVTLPSLLTMIALIVLLCCCTRPDSIICKICEVRVSEKPGGGSAKRRSARSARSAARSASLSARSQAPLLDEEAAVGVDEVEVEVPEDAPEEEAADEDMGDEEAPPDPEADADAEPEEDMGDPEEPAAEEDEDMD